jgi:hypothetical protein
MAGTDNNIVHDARTGFHDIRLPPMFESPDYFPFFAGASVLLVLAWLFFRVCRPNDQVDSKPELTPEEAALARLEELEQLRASEQISARNFGAEVSAALRDYLGAMFAFPAAEFTNREVLRTIRPAINQALPCLSSAKVEDLVQLTQDVLEFSERITYSPNAEAQAITCGKEVSQLCPQAIDIVRETAKQIKREEERTISVTKVGIATQDSKGVSDAL